MYNLLEVEDIQLEVTSQLYRKSLLNQIKLNNPEYKAAWFHKELAETLDQFLQDVVNKKNPHLLIVAPPRHGKSQAASRDFPARVLGLHPNLTIIATSYGDTLATAFNRDVQKIIDSPIYKAAYPNTRLAGKGVEGSDNITRNSEKFDIVGHKGFYKSAGVGQGITGMGGDILIVDDPFKDFEQANSAVQREAVWKWFTSTLYTRRQPGGGVLIIMTHWHEDDIIGRIKGMQARGELVSTYKMVYYPAIATEHEPHRKKGEALDPERYPLNVLLTIRALDTAMFEALFQGNPTIPGGNYFKAEHFGFYSELPNEFELDYLFMTGDTAQKTREVNDFSVVSLWAYSKKYNKLFLVDRLKGKWEAPELITNVIAFYKIHMRDPHKGKNIPLKGIYIEDKASGTGLIQHIQAKCPWINVIPIQRAKDKVTRAYATVPYTSEQKVVLPNEKKHPWVTETLKEYGTFPKGKHDDETDTMMDAVEIVFAKRGLYDNILPPTT